MVPYTITLLYDTMHLLKILHTVTLTKSLVLSFCTLVYEIYYCDICIILHTIHKSAVNTNNHGCLPIPIQVNLY